MLTAYNKMKQNKGTNQKKKRSIHLLSSFILSFTFKSLSSFYLDVKNFKTRKTILDLVLCVLL